MAKTSGETQELSFLVNGTDITGTHVVKRIFPTTGGNVAAVLAWLDGQTLAGLNGMAFSANQVNVIGSVTRKNQTTTGATDLHEVLAWVASSAGATALASSISGLTSAAWPSVQKIHVAIESLRSGGITATVQVWDSAGAEVYPTREPRTTAANLQAILAQVAADIGDATLSSAIAAI